MSQTLRDMAVEVLTTSDPQQKCALSRSHAATWAQARKAGKALSIGNATPPAQPARPEYPELLSPRDVPTRKVGTLEGRLAMLHAIAHIELNAVDLHWDMVARFPDIEFPMGFFDDWVSAADDEAKHFGLVSDCLQAHGSHYGAFPAHAGMWRSADETAHDIMARLAVVPMVLEARGLDVTPGMIKLFKQAKEPQAIAALEVIYAEEVAHVAYGSKWFHFLCGRHNHDPKPTFQDLVKRYFHGPLKAPFNEEKRADAGLSPDFYWPLADRPAPEGGKRE
ncbi:MAG: ferritin-like domain-containing protein [Litoreibacter sp.]